MKIGMKAKKNIEMIFLYIVVVIMIIFYVFPFFWAVLSSFIPNRYLFESNLGFTFQSGVRINNISNRSGFDIAGLKNNDYIQYINDENVKNANDLIKILKNYKEGEKINITVLRKEVTDVVDGVQIRKWNKKIIEAALTRSPDVVDQNNAYGLKLNITDGIKVDSVENSSAADYAGFKSEDIIIGIGERENISYRQFLGFLSQYTEGKEVQIKILRNGEEKLIKLVVPEYDLSKSDVFGLNVEDSHFTFEHYINVFKERPFHINILNSVIVAGATTILSLIIGSFAGYAVARLKIPGKIIIMGGILAVSMFPQVSIIGGLFQLLRNMNLINTYPGLIIPYIAINLPLTTWILQNFFRDLPVSIEESAYIDGCSKFETLWRIVLPLSIPGLVTTGLLTFINAWNEFLFALTFINKPEMFTVPVAIAMFQGKTQYEIPWGQLMAASVIITLPLVILVLIFQNKIVAGLTAGAVKG
ncbi:MAG: PDZ domain-containing protein [Thermotogae bacterium]|nr:PDZ domain-containing protein [Thermotogota bacterium]